MLISTGLRYRRFAAVLAWMTMLIVTPVRADTAPVSAVPVTGTPTVSAAAASSPVMWFEGLALLDSSIAGVSPKGAGVLMVLTTPLAFAEGSRTPGAENWVGGAGYLGLGIYNLSAFGDSYSRRLVFERNLLSWQLLGGGLWLADRLDAPPAVRQPLEHLALLPLPRGGFILAFHAQF